MSYQIVVPVQNANGPLNGVTVDAWDVARFVNNNVPAENSNPPSGSPDATTVTATDGAPGQAILQVPTQGAYNIRVTYQDHYYWTQSVAALPGPQGIQGVQGSQGIQGSVGSQGSTGPQGSTGATGSQGFQGVQGSQGTQGAIGPQGPQGIQGVTGDKYNTTSATSLTIGTGNKTLTVGATLSYSTAQTVIIAYDGSNYMIGAVTSYNSGTGSLVVNVTNAYGSGTYTSWTVSLDGAVGSQGVQGYQGVQGTQGSQGVTGAQGSTGSQGSPGATGAQGNQGYQGSTGAAGATGQFGLADQGVKTSDFTAVAGGLHRVDTTSNAVTVTLPSSPADLATVTVKIVAPDPVANYVTIVGGTFNRSGGSTSLTLKLINQGVILQFNTSAGVWTVISDDLSLAALDIRYSTGSPTGSAGGDLTGTYPNPTLATAYAGSSPVGSATAVPILTIDGKGRITATSTAAPSDTTKLAIASNLSDLNNAGTARLNLGVYARSINSVSSATNAGSASNTDYIYFVSGTTTITLPTAATNTNFYTVKNSGSNTVSIATTSSQTIDGSSSPITVSPGQSLTLASDTANWRIV